MLNAFHISSSQPSPFFHNISFFSEISNIYFTPLDTLDIREAYTVLHFDPNCSIKSSNESDRVEKLAVKEWEPTYNMF